MEPISVSIVAFVVYNCIAEPKRSIHDLKS
jgi:hypothetical protein